MSCCAITGVSFREATKLTVSSCKEDLVSTVRFTAPTADWAMLPVVGCLVRKLEYAWKRAAIVIVLKVVT